MFTMKTTAAANWLGLETMENPDFPTSKFSFHTKIARLHITHSYLNFKSDSCAFYYFVYEMKKIKVCKKFHQIQFSIFVQFVQSRKCNEYICDSLVS